MNISKIAQSSLVSAGLAAGGIVSAQNQTQHSSPSDLVNALHSAFGNNHSRAVHAKGIILEGIFTPNPSASSITRARHLQHETSKVIVRFSDFTGIPEIPDNIGAANPRGFAIKFISPDSSTTDIVAHSFNGFPTANSDQFRELLLAIGATNSATSKPTPLDQFLKTHPVAKTFLTTQHNPESYASISYFGVNAFKFVNSEGASHIVRYRFIPEKGEKLLTAEELARQSPDYLQKEITSHINREPVRFEMYAQVAGDGDDIENPSIAWPDNRKLVLLGVIELQKLSLNTPEADKKLSFMPNNIHDGIETADSMVNFRSLVYPISVKGRQ